MSTTRRLPLPQTFLHTCWWGSLGWRRCTVGRLLGERRRRCRSIVRNGEPIGVGRFLEKSLVWLDSLVRFCTQVFLVGVLAKERPNDGNRVVKLQIKRWRFGRYVFEFGRFSSGFYSKSVQNRGVRNFAFGNYGQGGEVMRFVDGFVHWCVRIDLDSCSETSRQKIATSLKLLILFWFWGGSRFWFGCSCFGFLWWRLVFFFS